MKKIIIGIIFFIILCFIYGYYINTNGFKISQYQIKNSSIPNSFDGFTIIQFSDNLIDSDEELKKLNNVVNTINELNPDIVVFTGDLTKDDYNDNKDKIINALKRIKVNFFKYAVIGDNDKKQLNNYSTIMEESDFIILDNDYAYIFNKDINPIKIIGLTNTNYSNELFSNEDNITPIFNIVLTHYPDNVDKFINNNIDLVLAGHSLNGQIRLPFFGGILRKSGAKKYVDNYYNINDTDIYISSGLGTEKIHFRLLNKPEINIYRLEK